MTASRGTATTDRILQVIDAGLQTPVPDPTFGEISPANDDGCTRCGVDLDGGDICADCRAFLLGDSDDDPAEAYTGPTLELLGASVAEAAAVFSAFQTVLGRVAAQMAASINQLARAVNELPDEEKAALGIVPPGGPPNDR